MTSSAIVNQIISITADSVFAILRNENRTLDTAILTEKMYSSKKEWIPKIIEEAKEDAEKADIMNGLPTQRIDPLVQTAFAVALQHGCTNWAKFLTASN